MVDTYVHMLRMCERVWLALYCLAVAFARNFDFETRPDFDPLHRQFAPASHRIAISGTGLMTNARQAEWRRFPQAHHITWMCLARASKSPPCGSLVASFARQTFCGRVHLRLRDSSKGSPAAMERVEAELDDSLERACVACVQIVGHRSSTLPPSTGPSAHSPPLVLLPIRARCTC
jgi:hypothetical protein